jgi:hypothetical protein
MTRRAAAGPFLSKRTMQRLMAVVSIGMLAVILAGEGFLAATPVSASWQIVMDTSQSNGVVEASETMLTSSDVIVRIKNKNSGWVNINVNGATNIKASGTDGGFYAGLRLLRPDATAAWDWHIDPSHPSSVTMSTDISDEYPGDRAGAINAIDALAEALGVIPVAGISGDILGAVVDTLLVMPEFAEGIRDLA